MDGIKFDLSVTINYLVKQKQNYYFQVCSDKAIRQILVLIIIFVLYKCPYSFYSIHILDPHQSIKLCASITQFVFIKYSL